MQHIIPIPSPYLFQKIHPKCFEYKEKIVLSKNLRHDEYEKLRTVKEEKQSTYCPWRIQGKVSAKVRLPGRDFGCLAEFLSQTSWIWWLRSMKLLLLSVEHSGLRGWTQICEKQKRVEVSLYRRCLYPFPKTNLHLNFKFKIWILEDLGNWMLLEKDEGVLKFKFWKFLEILKRMK